MQRIFTDQMNRTMVVTYPPRRIVSLVPSQTELLHALGLEEAVVGITKFCVHPETWFRTKTRVGGTKQLHLDKIEVLAPDLIIGNKEENDRSQIEALAEKFPVWMSDIQTLEDALEMIAQVGTLLNREAAASALRTSIEQQFARLAKPESILRAAYFIWRKPYMVAAGSTFIDSMLQRAGFENVFGALSRYPEVTLEDLAKAKPDVILLSSEPYPFKNAHLEAFQRVCPLAVVQLVDGELFSWYGSRLLQAASYFRDLHKGFVAHFKHRP